MSTQPPLVPLTSVQGGLCGNAGREPLGRAGKRHQNDVPRVAHASQSDKRDANKLVWLIRTGIVCGALQCQALGLVHREGPVYA